MWPSFEPAPPADERDARFDAAASQFAAPLARLAGALEDHGPGRAALLDEIHVALWRSLADYDERISLRTWVFRVAFHVVAAHEPNTQDRPPGQDTPSQTWQRRRARKSLRTLEQATGLAGSVSGFIQGLKPPDRELVFLYLEDVGIEEAREITGWPAARLEGSYELIAKLLVPETRDAWKRQSSDASPGSRFLVRQRIQEMHGRNKREARIRLVIAPFVASLFVVQALLGHRRYRLAIAAFAVIAVAVAIEAWQTRRRLLEAPESHAAARIDTSGFRRRLLVRELDELRKGMGWKEWLFTVGILLYVLVFPLERGSGWTWPLVVIGTMLALSGLSWWMKSRKAALLERQIEDISH